MKKRIWAALLCAAMLVTVCGCGEGSSGNSGITNNGVKADPPTVTSLADISDLKTVLKGDYEVTEEKINNMFNSMLCAANAGLIRVKDREVVQAGDVVQVDYTGYLNDKAFANGAATNQMVDVSKNCTFDTSSGSTGSTFIDGFCDGMIGAAIDKPVKHNVKFPDNYSEKTLAGQMTTFEFNIDRIYIKAMPNTVDDAYVNRYLGDQGYTTVESLVKYCEEEVVFSMIMGYALDKSNVNISQAYLNERLSTYEKYTVDMWAEFYGEEFTIEEIVYNAYNSSIDVIRPYWLSYIKQQVIAEVVFAEIVKSKNLTHDEKEVEDFIKELMEKNTSYKTVEDVYHVMAYGDATIGQTYLQNEFAVKNYVITAYEALKAVTE